VISGDGQELFTDRRDLEVLPYLEWGINWRVMATRSNYLQLHSAAMVYGGQGVIFAGASGCGKSTLAAGLLSRGWTYLSDEFGLIDPDTTYLHSFPKALCIKAGSFDLIERLDLPLRRRRHYVKAFKGRVAYISPQDVGPQMEAAPGPIRFVIFPEYIEGGEPRLRPLSPGRAAFALAGHALNRNVFGSRAISILSAVVRGAECFRLESGPLEPTCALIDALVRDRGPAPARG
jgi:hypothetical protein